MSGFTEIDDAGQLLSTAQVVNSQPPETALESISGKLKPVAIGDQFVNDVDLYKIYLTGKGTFSATVTDDIYGYGYGTGIDLFDENGYGVYATSLPNPGNPAGLVLPAGHPLTPREPGIYYLGITSDFVWSAESSEGAIFEYSQEFSGLADPSGPGGGATLSDWFIGEGYDGSYEVPYTITLTGAEFVEGSNGVDLDPLWAEIVDGEFTFNPQTNRHEASGTILIGLKGEPFKPLVTVAGSLWYDDQTIHVDGTVSPTIGDVTVPLFNGAFEINRGEAITSLLGLTH